MPTAWLNTEDGAGGKSVAMSAEPTQLSRGAGGTPGGVGEFCVGLVMACVGGYLLLNQVTVTTGFWSLWGYNALGLTLVPLLVGIGWLFFDGHATVGWLLVVVGAAIIFAGILVNLHLYFRPTSLFNTLMMLTLLVGGLALVARSLRPH
jgi:uncharacterized protein